MAKTVAPGTIEVPGVGAFSTNAVPDPFDARDLEYRPRLQALPALLDPTAGGRRHIYQQQGESCTGHAVASMINTVLRATRRSGRVSPYMLYRLARRYDAFPGEADAGSSLRAAFKGWFNHGVALERDWPNLEMANEPDPDDEANRRSWRDRPLGAFYRVNPFRLDDVQSAINELYAVAASGVVHEGWKAPVAVHKNGRTVSLIQRPVDARRAGGHAYCLVGYNEIGFLVQNSWGPEWGDGGFATLPYDDWLDTVYDAWVARPGVPQTPFYMGRTRTAVATGGVIATGSGADLQRLAYHVINTGNDGHLSTAGKFVSTPAQLDRIVDHMGAWHEFFLDRGRTDRRHVAIWSHGGGVAETNGLAIAERHLNWWLNNGVYPITFVWETGAFETLRAAIEDLLRDNLPTGGIGFDLVEQFDRLVEGVCRRRMRWAWREMKENARLASAPIADAASLPGTASSTDRDRLADLPGASLLVSRLAKYVRDHGAENVSIHLAAHSAGSIHQAALLDRLAEAGLRVETLTWLAPAISVDEFVAQALPHLGTTVERFGCFDLSDTLELNDTVGPVYHKSAVYLVARGFEDKLGGSVSEVPILGLAKYWDRPVDGSPGPTLRATVEAVGGELVVARSASPVTSRTDATTHAAFDEDQPTMTSVIMRARRAAGDPAPFAYQSNAPLLDEESAPWTATGPRAASARQVAQQPVRRRRSAAHDDAVAGGGPRMGAAPEPDATPLTQTVETGSPAERTVATEADSPRGVPTAPRRRTRTSPSPEVAVAPRTGSAILDVVQADGWDLSAPSSLGSRGQRTKGGRR